MSPVEIALALTALIGVIWATILLTNDEFEKFQRFEYDELEQRRRFQEAMERHPAKGPRR